MVDFKLLKEMAGDFQLKFKPKIEQVFNVTDYDLVNNKYKLLGTHVLGFYDAFVKPEDYQRLQGIDEGLRPFPNEMALLGVLGELTDYFRKKKSLNVLKLSEPLEMAIATFEQKTDKATLKLLQTLSNLPQTSQGGPLPILTNLITLLGDLPSERWKDPGTMTHISHAKISTASIYKERNPSQIEVMKISATKVSPNTSYLLVTDL